MNPSRSISPFLAAFFIALLTLLLTRESIYLPESYSSCPFAPKHMQSIVKRAASQLNPLAFASRLSASSSSSRLLKNWYSNMSSDNPEQQKSGSAASDTADSDSFHPGNKQAEGALPLPAPGEGTSDVQTIDLGGETIDLGGEGGGQVRLDALGPMVVNKDGTLSRIANWQKMTEIEKKNTLRILGKRNQLRLGALRGEEEQKTPAESK